MATMVVAGTENSNTSHQESKRIMEGPLCKWTNVVHGWQYRWFVLDKVAGLLSYYTVRHGTAGTCACVCVCMLVLMCCWQSVLCVVCVCVMCVWCVWCVCVCVCVCGVVVCVWCVCGV